MNSMKRFGNKKKTFTSRPNMKPVPDSLREHEVYYICDNPGELHIEGYDIHISEIIDEETSELRKFNDPCKNSKPFREITMFGQNSVVINKNINGKNLTDGELQLVIAAPNWQINGPVVVNLEGSKGKNHKSMKASNGTHFHYNGNDGIAGLSGTPGGSFLGIAGQIKGTLKINADGGSGGAGQDGGDGVEAKLQSYPVPSKVLGQPPCDRNLCENHTMPSLSNYGINETFACEKYEQYAILYKITPNVGHEAGNGGNGGKSGPGGTAGQVQLYQLKEKVNVPISTKTGTDGAPGKGGKGGKGKNGYIKGRTVNIELKTGKTIEKICSVNLDYEDEVQVVYPKNKIISSGNDGANDMNMDGRKQLDKTIILKRGNIINRYKAFLRRNLNRSRHNKRVNDIREFIKIIDNNEEMRNSYDTLDLVEEFKYMEKELFALDKKVDYYAPLYKSLLERLLVHARKYENDPQHRKVISYLYTAAYSRLCNLKENPGSLLILDMRAHLSNFAEKLKGIELKKEELSGLTRSVEIVNDLNNQKQNYKNSIDKKIEETMSFRKDIVTDIDGVERLIDDNIHLLLKEVEEELRKTDKNINELQSKREQLQRQMIWRGIFNTVRIVGEATKFLGPVGIAANTFIQGTSAVIEPIFLGANLSTNAPTQVPTAVNNLQELIKSIKASRIEPYKTELSELSKEIEKHSSELGKFKEEISNTMSDLNQVSTGEDIEEIDDRLEKQKSLLEAKINGKEEKYEGIIKRLENLERISKLGAGLYNVCSSLATNAQEIKTIDSAIKLNKEAFKKLISYEQDVHDVLTPILDLIAGDMVSAAGNMDGKSRAALNITKWKIRNHLSTIKTYITEFTKGKNIQPAFLKVIEDLNEAMNALIDLYSLIQTYEEQKNFGDYLGNLISTSVSQIKIEDSALQLAKDELEVILSSNLVLQEYKKTIVAFKQFVFPYADKYFKNLDFLSNKIAGESSLKALEPEGNTVLSGSSKSRYFNMIYFDGVLEKVSTVVKHLSQMLKDESIILSDLDSCSFSGQFEPSSDTYPFVIWDSAQYNNSISKLLSGDEITLIADIRLSPIEYDAVKFTKAKLKFIAKNAVLQEKINKELQSLKLTMTHFGNSHYRYANEYYKMTTKSLNMTYHLRDETHKDENYIKISNGVYVLSPYATWKFHLFPTKYENNNSFEILKEVSNDVDLVLVGHGHYVNAHLGQCPPENMIYHYQKINLPHLTNFDRVIQKRSIESIRESNLNIPKLKRFKRFLRNNRSTGTSSPGNSYNWVKERIGKLLSNASFLNMLPQNIRKLVPGVVNLDTQATSYTPGTISGEPMNAVPDNTNNIYINHPLTLSSTKKEDTNILQSPKNVDSNGLLLLTNLLVRKLTGEKYKQPALFKQERAERINDLKQQVFSALEDFKTDQKNFHSGQLNDKFKLFN